MVLWHSWSTPHRRPGNATDRIDSAGDDACIRKAEQPVSFLVGLLEALAPGDRINQHRGIQGAEGCNAICARRLQTTGHRSLQLGMRSRHSRNTKHLSEV